MAFHDLFALALRENNRAEAERCARGALEAYRAVPERIPRLAHDVAYWWMEHGYYSHAMRVFTAVRPHLSGEDQLRVIANLARTHAGLGDNDQYQVFVREARSAVRTQQPQEFPAFALLEMAYGAVALEQWPQAMELISETIETARGRGESDVLLIAEALSDAVSRRDPVPVTPMTASSRAGTSEQLANDLVELLAAADPA
jgi:hypothetical protein